MVNDAPAAQTVRQVMREDMPTVRAEDPLGAVARALVAANASSLPVLDGSAALVGIVSEYDVLAKEGRTAEDVMSRGVISIGPDATAADAARLMGLHGVRVLPVMDDGRLVGLITRADLLQLYTETRWICAACGKPSHGLSQPDACVHCGGRDLTVDPAT